MNKNSEEIEKLAKKIWKELRQEKISQVLEILFPFPSPIISGVLKNLMKRCHHSSQEEMKKVVHLLAVLGREKNPEIAIPYLIQALQYEEIRKSATIALSKQGHSVLPYLSSLLSSSKIRHQIAGAWIAGKLGKSAKMYVPDIIKLIIQKEETKFIKVGKWALIRISQEVQISQEVLEALNTCGFSEQTIKNYHPITLCAIIEIFEKLANHSPEIQNFLLLLLGHPNSEVQATALTALGNLQEEKALSKILTSIESSDLILAQAAIEALSQFDHKQDLELAPLWKATENSHLKKIAFVALTRLSKTKDKLAKKIIARLLKEEDKTIWKDSMKEMLGWQENISLALPLLSKTLASQDPELNLLSLEIAKKIGPMSYQLLPFLAKIFKKDLAIDKKIIEVLGAMGERAIPHLLKITAHCPGDLRKHICSAFIQIGPSVIPALLEALQGKDQKKRQIAVEVLGNMGEKALSPLLELLSHPNFWIKKAVGQALQKIGKPAASHLIKIIETTPGIDQKFIYQILTSMKGQALPELIHALHSPYPPLSQFALRILKKVDSSYEEALPDLLYIAKNAESLLRQSAIWAIGNIGIETEEVLQVLEHAQKDQDPLIQKIAREAMEKLG